MERSGEKRTTQHCFTASWLLFALLSSVLSFSGSDSRESDWAECSEALLRRASRGVEQLTLPWFQLCLNAVLLTRLHFFSFKKAQPMKRISCFQFYLALLFTRLPSVGRSEKAGSASMAFKIPGTQLPIFSSAHCAALSGLSLLGPISRTKQTRLPEQLKRCRQ